MAKKKSSNSFLNIIWGILTLAGLVLLVMPMFLSIFEQNVGASGVGSLNLGEFGIFANMDAFGDSAALATTVSVMFVIALALAAIYMITYALKAFNVIKADVSKILKVIAVIELLLFIVTLICGLVFANDVSVSDSGTGYNMVCSVGFWLGIVGMIVTSVFGFLAAKK